MLFRNICHKCAEFNNLICKTNTNMTDDKRILPKHHKDSSAKIPIRTQSILSKQLLTIRPQSTLPPTAIYYSHPCCAIWRPPHPPCLFSNPRNNRLIILWSLYTVSNRISISRIWFFKSSWIRKGNTCISIFFFFYILHNDWVFAQNALDDPYFTDSSNSISTCYRHNIFLFFECTYTMYEGD